MKLAFARQAGDEAGHFQLVAERLAALGFDVAGFRAPGDSPLFQYLKGLSTTVERIAAGLFTLESIAYGVNENFMASATSAATPRRSGSIASTSSPTSARTSSSGQRLLAKYATTPELQQAARERGGPGSRDRRRRAHARPLSGWAPPASRAAEEIPGHLGRMPTRVPGSRAGSPERTTRRRPYGIVARWGRRS